MTSISKNVYIDKLDDLVIMTNILNLKLVILLEYQNIKIFLQKVYIPDCSEEVFVIKRIQKIVPWTYVISDLKGEVIVGTFYKKELQKNKSKRV